MISVQAASATGRGSGRAGCFGGFRTRWALLISVAGGLALFAAFPPVDAWPLAFAGPALLVVALTGRSLRASFGCGLAFGLGFGHQLVIPMIAASAHRRLAFSGTGGMPSRHDHLLDRRAPFHRLVRAPLERHHLAAPVAEVRRDQHLRLRVIDAVA